MTIAHVFYSRSWGGAEIYSVDLACWQKESGLDIVYWCLPDSPIYFEAKKRGLKVITDKLYRRQPFVGLFKIYEVVKREKLTHLHLHWAGGVWSFFGIKKLTSVKMIYHTHMWLAYSKRDPIHWLAYHELNAVTVAGDRARKVMLEKLPINQEQIDYIPYGIDFSSYDKKISTDDEKSQLRDKFNLPTNKQLIGFFGRIDKQKGVKEFLLATEKVLKEFLNVDVVLVGDPTKNEEEAAKYEVEIKKIIEESPYKNRIHRFGHQKDFQTLLKSIDLLVLPSYNESYSILIVTAFALGVPVVSTQSGGTPDLIHSDRGWLVPPKTVKPLEELLIQLCKNPNEITQKRQAGFDYAWSNHSHKVIVQKFNKIYEAY